ncbi:sulfotransferase family protein [Hyphococcus lacteus]|uniref:Sulfotransferase family protein n=1 Tax=Hyphococcus lacteus TaxID=3143536 RepID=A0ABV3Z129_9PROT
MPKLIAIAGVPRSGTTWLYNAVRLIHDRAGRSIYGAWCADYDPNTSASRHLIKVHKPEQLHAHPEITFATNRDVAESLASLVRMGWLADEEVAIKNAATNHQRLRLYWEERADYIAQYEEVTKQPLTVIEGLCSRLEILLEKSMSEAIAHELAMMQSPKSGNYDPVTLLHPGHRSDAKMNERQVDRVREILRKTKTDD